MKILFFGDVVGKSGRRAVLHILPEWKKIHRPDIVIANGENIAHGKGVSGDTLREVLSSGVDIVTSGNHIWNFKEAWELLKDPTIPLLRPANYADTLPGNGARLVSVASHRLLVVNLMGQAGMGVQLDSPFRKADEILHTYALPGNTRKDEEIVHAIVVDWHAEMTSEKVAMGWYLDGRVSAVLGTHTHVPTADERILPKGTAFISDIGMVGARHSIIGVGIEPNLKRLVENVPAKLEVAEDRTVDVNAVLVEIHAETGRATDIQRLQTTVTLAENF